jgi:hypothetical protein
MSAATTRSFAGLPSRRARRTTFAAVLALVALGAAAPAPAGPPARPDHVVLVVFGGGVRTKELLGRSDLCPTIHAIGAAGFSSSEWAAGGFDPVDGTKSILTGRDVPVETPGRTRRAWPTVMEYARKGLGLPATAVWYASFADGEALDLAASDHADYGAPFAPSVAVGDGPFGEPLKALFRLFGRPNPTTPRTWELLNTMRATSGREAAKRLGITTDAAAAQESRRLERALLDEVDRRSRDLSGAAGLDARAIRAGITALRVFRPRLLVIRLGQADVAQKDLYAYWDVLKRDDAEIARLRVEIAGDPVLRTTTTLLVVSDVGRDAGQNAAGGFGRSDGSPDATTVALVGEGPGLRKDVSLHSPRSIHDLCPTIGRLLGFPTPHAEGAAREDLVTAK